MSARLIVKPFGGVIAGPLHQEKGILYAEVSLEDARHARKSLDVAGHCGRPYIFSLEVERRGMPPVSFR